MTRFKAVTKFVFNEASFGSLQASDNSRKIKSQHLNKGKLHLTIFGITVSTNFVNEISKVVH